MIGCRSGLGAESWRTKWPRLTSSSPTTENVHHLSASIAQPQRPLLSFRQSSDSHIDDHLNHQSSTAHHVRASLSCRRLPSGNFLTLSRNANLVLDSCLAAPLAEALFRTSHTRL